MSDLINTVLGGFLAGGVGIGVSCFQRWRENMDEEEKNKAEVKMALQEMKNYLDYFEAFLKKQYDAVYNFPCRVVLPSQFQKQVRFISCSQKLQEIFSEYNNLVYKIQEMKEHLDNLEPQSSPAQWLKGTTLGTEVTSKVSEVKDKIVALLKEEYDT